jgi:hypothetical protein
MEELQVEGEMWAHPVLVASTPTGPVAPVTTPVMATSA